MLLISYLFLLWSNVISSYPAGYPRVTSLSPLINLAGHSIQLNQTFPEALGLNLTTSRIATRQLVDHFCFMRIEYHTSHPLPYPQREDVLTDALLQIGNANDWLGDGAIVERQISTRRGDVAFVADANVHAPSRTLTYGVLEEAVAVLIDFIHNRPYEMTASIWEGLIGTGLPLGDMVVANHPESVLLRGGYLRTS